MIRHIFQEDEDCEKQQPKRKEARGRETNYEATDPCNREAGKPWNQWR